MSENACCVCLSDCKRNNVLIKEDTDCVTFLYKLQNTIPDVTWQHDFIICDSCLDVLKIVYTFRQTCLSSETLRKQEIEELIDEQLFNKESKNFKPKKENTSGVDDFDYIKPNCNTDLEFNHEYSSSDDEPKCKPKRKVTKRKSKVISNFKKGLPFKDEITSDVESDALFNINGNDYFSSSDEKPLKDAQTTQKRAKRFINFTCETCSAKFNTSTKLIDHCVEEHDISEKDVKPFTCERCPKRFANSSNLFQHIKYHDAVRSHICKYCGKGFITKTDVNVHEKQHLNKREYQCEECHKCYNTHKDLRSHKLVVHTDSSLWKYRCEYCDKRFPIKSNLDCHMRRHTGDRKFQCHLCTKKFTDKCVLQRHMRTHSNVRDFKCQMCDREYKDKRVMQVHMVKAHGISVGTIKIPSKERRYICHICPKAYFAKNKLTRHLYTHSGEKPFYCTICNRKFNDKSYVRQHIKKTHNIKTDDLNDIIGESTENIDGQ